MKTCKDCKWIADPGPFAKCNAPQNMKAPTGYAVRRWDYCEVHREAPAWFPLDILYGLCGKRGRWFEPKPDHSK
jgi:hypothetical protein